MKKGPSEKQSGIADQVRDRKRTSVVLSGDQHARDTQEDREALIQRGRELSEEYSKIEKIPKQDVSTSKLVDYELEAIWMNSII